MEIEEIRKALARPLAEVVKDSDGIYKACALILEYCQELENRIKTLEESLGRMDGELGIFRPLRS